MLYQDKPLGQSSLPRRMLLRLQHALSGRRYADLDLLSMNRHLQRDIGIAPPDRMPSALDIWRK